jgi:hypothetical protein
MNERALEMLADRTRRAISDVRATRAHARRARADRAAQIRPDGTAAVLPITQRGGWSCAVDGDGSRVCDGVRVTDVVVGYQWCDVPPIRRCLQCAIVLGDL